MSTTTNFFKAIAEHKDPPKQKIFFRLYYDKKTGALISYSMEDLDGDYIEITAEEFAIANPNVYVKNGEIKERKLLNYGKMKPSDDGFAVCPTDISLVDPDSTTYWKFQTDESD
jgi:hypothetical protein